MASRYGKLSFALVISVAFLLILNERKVITSITTFDIGTSSYLSSHLHQTENAKDERMTPFFIGAGPGTTASSSVFRALCSLGIPTVHFRRNCTRTSLEEPINESLKLGVDAHYKSAELLLRMNSCCHRSRERNVTYCPDFDDMVSSLLEEAKKVVGSGLMAAVDTPYPYILQHMRNVAKETGRLGIIVLTEREPKSWLNSRSYNHPTTSGTMCDHVEFAFDLQACVRKEKSQNRLMMRFSERNMTTEDEQFFIDAMKTHQRNVKNMHPVIQLNVWNEALRLGSDLRQALLMRMKNLVSPEFYAYHSNATALKVEVRRSIYS
eukprot:scaffold4247_cov66-Cylindrotheca_fusiformis.AAC.6